MHVVMLSVCLLLFLNVSAICFYCYAIYAARDLFASVPRSDPRYHPPVTILKPMRGLDSDAYTNFASLCQQDYPEYQIIFGVRDEQDPGVEVVRRIMDDFPHIDVRLVVSDDGIGTNPKVSTLTTMEAKARYPILVISDSDIRVGPDYLQRIVQPLRDPTVGVVTCMYRSLARGWVTAFGAVGISTAFHAGVLVARKLEGMKFALGATVLIRRAALDAIGGCRSIADYLADDFQLGYRASMAGYTVSLSDYVVEHVVASESFVDVIRRQTRWTRGARVSRPWGYTGLIFTHGTVTALLFWLATGGSALGWGVLGATWMARLAMAWVVGARYLNDQVARKCLWLVPAHDLLSFALWCYSFLGDTVHWRGQRFRLTKGGQLVPLTAARPMTPAKPRR